MLPTLQWYILREMGKTFSLTAVGLTVVLGLGGGAMNLIAVERVSASQLLGLMVIVLPVVSTLTLPVAALYSATVTYGRLSADNEFLACRASGINVIRLFLPPAVISLLSAACTFYFISFMIPGLVRDLNTFARTGIRQFVEQQVGSPERLLLPGGRGRIYADGTARSREDQDTVVLYGFAYLEVGKRGWRKIGTGEKIVLRFAFDDTDSTPTLTGELHNVIYYDRQKGNWGSFGFVKLGQNKIRLRIRLKVKWLDLGELLRYRQNPEGWPKVATLLGRVRDEVVRWRYYTEVFEEYRASGEVNLNGRKGLITLHAGAGTPDALGDGGLTFTDVVITDARGGVRRTITGDDARLFVGRAAESGPTYAVLEVSGHVTIREQGVAGEPLQKGRERFEDIWVPEHIRTEVSQMADAALLDDRLPAELPPAASRLCVQAIEARARFSRELTSELHSRLAFSASALVLVLLGAALGMLLRGSQVMVAFGISFVPSLFVTVMNIMGRQLAEKPGTTTLGLFVIWGAIVAVGALDAWVLYRVIRR